MSRAHEVVKKWWDMHMLPEEGASAVDDGDANLELDYIEFNDPDTFDVVPDNVTRTVWEADGYTRRPMILSGAMYVGKKVRTRLIDNMILGDATALGMLQ